MSDSFAVVIAKEGVFTHSGHVGKNRSSPDLNVWKGLCVQIGSLVQPPVFSLASGH